MKSFQAFRLDTVNHCLWRGEKRVSVAPKAFDVLRYLVEHADRLVPQDEILEKLWPETYVNPEVVKKYVLEIRKALGDKSNKPVYIATFPRRGYQFIAPVRDEQIAEISGTSGLSSKIVGREGALNRLGVALGKALHGERQIVFISGEAGIGKTTLVDAFVQRASSSGVNARTARGQCVEGFGGKEAYYPMLDALGQLFRESNDDRFMRELVTRAPTWVVQFPSLVSTEQRHVLEKEIVGATRERMVREICETLETIAAQKPLILLLEDLHWVDPSTLDFISALARRRGPAKLLLLGTYRPADVIISQSPLKALKQDLVIHNLSEEISLERLEEADVAEYVAMEFAEADFPAGFAKAIYEQSGGNALFMVTILRDMVKKQLIRQVDGRSTLTAPLEKVAANVPETLDQLIDMQFQQLSAVEQSVLRTGSVAGERFSAWAIADALAPSPEIVEEVCEKLVEKLQFIKSAGMQKLANGEMSAHYEFVHSLYREVLYRRLSEASRSRLHLQLAERLRNFCSPCEQELATELALHFEGGHDHQEAIYYLVLAAENAARRFAHRDSIEILQHAMELAAGLAPAQRIEMEVGVLEFIGYGYFALGKLPESAAAYEAAASRAAQADLKTDQIHALIGAMYPLGFIDPDRGLAAIDQAAEMSMSIDDPVLTARTQLVAAACHLVFDAWTRKDAERYASAQDALQRLGDSGADPHQRVVCGHVLTLEGKYQEALETLESGISSEADRHISLIRHFGAVSGKILALQGMGNLGEVLRITQSGRATADEHLARFWQASVREAWLRTTVFDHEGALRICEPICKISAPFDPGQAETIALIVAGYTELDRGDYCAAIETFQKVHRPAVLTKFFLHWVWRMTAELETGNAWLLSGDISKAKTVAESFLESALSTADPHLQTLAWDLCARVAMAENDVAEGQEHIQKALAIVEKFEIPAAAWQAYGTAWLLCEREKKTVAAEANRKSAENCILKIAHSFAADEPLRRGFLQAAPVRRILQQTVGSDAMKQNKLSADQH